MMWTDGGFQCNLTILLPVCVVPESLMRELTAAAPGLARQAAQAVQVTHTHRHTLI